MDRKKIIKEYEAFVDKYECFSSSDDYVLEMHKAVLAMLKEQERQLNEYHKADTFLAVHGFWSDNPPYGVKTSAELERP